MIKLYIFLFICISISSCSYTSDLPRTLWGSSVRVLEQERDSALVKEFRCARAACFDTIFDMTQSHQEQKKDSEATRLLRFMFSRAKEYIVVMHVPEAVDTTEVGIFFEESQDGVTRVEISSLSTRAKSKVASIVFEQLGNQYETVK